MKQEEIIREVKKILATSFRLAESEIQGDSSLTADLGLDSVDIMDSICLYEEKFGIKIVKESMTAETFPKTVRDCAKLVMKRIEEKTQGL
ncbi:MAG: acyl carrier protein [Candidatus Omnitrophota bacterium]